MPGVIGIELGLLEELIRTIVRQEMAAMKGEIKTILVSKHESLFKEERLYTDQVVKLLGIKSRHTIGNRLKRGDFPEPKRDLANRPYWTPDQLEDVLRKQGVKAKFPL